MRIDLVNGGRRPWYMALAMRLAKLRIGIYPGPPLAMTYRTNFMTRPFLGYILRGMHGAGGWTKGEAEMFSAFVSDLNTCHF